MDVDPDTPLPTPAHANHDQQTPSTPSTPQFDSTFSVPTDIYFHNTVDPGTASLTTCILGPNLAATFTHSRAPSLFPTATILTGLTKKTTGFLALIPPGAHHARTVLAWAESGHGHGPEGDLLDRQPSVLANNLWARRVIKLSSIMGISLGHPFDRLTRGGRPGIFRASHVEVKLATHAIYTLLKIFRISGAVMTMETLARLRRRTKWQDGSRPRFEIYFSKKNCQACAAYVRRLGELTGVEITLCWKSRLVEMEYQVARMGEARPSPSPSRALAQGVITVEDDEDDDHVRPVDTVDLTGDADRERERETTPQPLGTFLDGLAYCVGQGSTDRVARAVVGLARIRKRQRRSSLVHHHHHHHQRTPVGETGDAQDWLATPPSSSRRREGRVVRRDVEDMDVAEGAFVYGGGLIV